MWAYNKGGNIENRREFPYTTGAVDIGQIAAGYVEYTYGNTAWGDLLTHYNGHDISYDEIGNPLDDGVWNYTWQHGRQLASMAKKDGSATWNYTYDADGMRVTRSDGTNSYRYFYHGGQLLSMTRNGTNLYFAYSPEGKPLSLVYNGTAYYYATNIQGDVVAILDQSGNAVVRYSYDAWGKQLSCTGTMAATLGTLNPLRYRGYVYDQETGLYYVSSRYYDPEIGRWINADNQIAGVGGEVLGYNMFAYCMNNPVNMSDPSGNWPLSRFLATVVETAITIIKNATIASFGAQFIRTVRKNIEASKKPADKAAVDRLLENADKKSKHEFQLPQDSEGLLYNKENRLYASEYIKKELGPDTNRTTEDISAEIFAHQFGADFIKPYSGLIKSVIPSSNLYGQLSKADINEDEKRIIFFNIMEAVLEWE